ncbi:hypothetical protein U1Q18_052187 [Sarracenia purpurea var. burkii]
MSSSFEDPVSWFSFKVHQVPSFEWQLQSPSIEVLVPTSPSGYSSFESKRRKPSLKVQALRFILIFWLPENYFLNSVS